MLPTSTSAIHTVQNQADVQLSQLEVLEKDGVLVLNSKDDVSVKSESATSVYVPFHLKVISVILVTAIGFGSHWSTSVTNAMKSTLKKVQ